MLDIDTLCFKKKRDYSPSTGVFFIFPPHLLRAPTIPWETVET